MVVVLTSLLTMTLIALFVEHFFGTPSTVFATSISAILLLAPAYSGLERLGPLYWALLSWCAALVVVAAAGLSILPGRDERGAKADRARAMSLNLKRVGVRYGGARLVFGMIGIVTALMYLTEEPTLLGLTFVYTVALMGLDTARRSSSTADSTAPTGQVTRVEPNGIIRAAIGRADLQQGTAVAYALPADDESTCRTGVVADVYLTLTGPEAVILAVGRCPATSELKLEPGDLVVASQPLLPEEVGLVSDQSSISSLRVQTLSLKQLSEGALLSVPSGHEPDSKDVLYQIVDARVHSDDSQGLTIAEAIQLGIWSESDCGFVRHGWVPRLNSRVTKVVGDCSTTVPGQSILLGHLPGTRYPVALDRDTLRGTHVAILGVTGCGKSVTSRYLLRELAADDARVVVIDLTGEYKRLLLDPAPNPIVSEEAQSRLIAAIEILMKQMAEFPNKRIQSVIDNAESILDEEFRESLHGWFAAADGTYALLELPSFENTAASLEYTRWFLRTLFDIGRMDGFDGKSVTVVLEEAHTVVPEWNFVGAKGDKSAEGLLNSIAQIALQGRKYGIGFIVIAQRTANVSKTVLTQCSSVIAFRSYDHTSAEFLSNYLGEDLAKALPNLPDRHAIVVGSAFLSQVPLICRVLDVDEPVSSTVLVVEETPWEPTFESEYEDAPADYLPDEAI